MSGHASVRRDPSHPSQQPRLSIQMTPKASAFKPPNATPALTKTRSQSSSALDLLQLCEQANAAVRDRARPSARSQLAVPPRNLSLAHRQALEAAQRRHLDARQLQAARLRDAGPSHSRLAARLSVPMSGGAK